MIAAFLFAPRRTRQIRLLATLCLGALPARSALAQQLPSTAASRAGAAAKPGDKVLLKIYREAELSGDFVVPESGEVDFPKIGLIRVDRIRLTRCVRCSSRNTLTAFAIPRSK